MNLFSPEDRDRVQERVLAWASEDARVTAGAVVGSLARSVGDRWSDLDLTFGVADEVPVPDVLDDWTRRVETEFGAVRLFDLPSGPTIYRVFLLPGCLQFDLSFTPAARFGARGPNFRLLFGAAAEPAHAPPPAAESLFGRAVHHALRARFCIERGRLWHAEFWTSGVRDYALHLACRRRGLPAYHGRGFDDLPADVRDRFRDALVRSLEPGELRRALACAIEGLQREATEVPELAARVASSLATLASRWDP